MCIVDHDIAAGYVCRPWIIECNLKAGIFLSLFLKDIGRKFEIKRAQVEKFSNKLQKITFSEKGTRKEEFVLRRICQMSKWYHCNWMVRQCQYKWLA